jgi:hypothetical protein
MERGTEGEALSEQLHRWESKRLLALAQVARPALWVCGLLVLVSCRPLFQREVSGAVLALEGSAKGTVGGKTVGLTTNDWIHPGEKIATNSESRLDLMLLPGILVELTGETEIEITRLRFARDGDETIRPVTAREASLRLIRGTLVASVGQAQTRSRIFVQTAAGNLTAFNLCTFKIEAGENQARFIAVRGKTTFKPAESSAPVRIDAGYFAEWPVRPTGPRAAIQSDPTVQAEVGQILRVENKLFRLQKQRGAGLAPWRR